MFRGTRPVIYLYCCFCVKITYPFDFFVLPVVFLKICSSRDFSSCASTSLRIWEVFCLVNCSPHATKTSDQVLVCNTGQTKSLLQPQVFNTATSIINLNTAKTDLYLALYFLLIFHFRNAAMQGVLFVCIMVLVVPCYKEIPFLTHFTLENWERKEVGLLN